MIHDDLDDVNGKSEIFLCGMLHREIVDNAGLMVYNARRDARDHTRTCHDAQRDMYHIDMCDVTCYNAIRLRAIIRASCHVVNTCNV